VQQDPVPGDPTFLHRLAGLPRTAAVIANQRFLALTFLSIRHTATMRVVIEFLAFLIRYIGLLCSGSKSIRSDRFIGVVAV
jgi:hypothetical protein